MLRRFTKDIGRYRKGELRDYPQGVWETMAANAKRQLASFTEAPNLPPEVLLDQQRSGGGLASPKGTKPTGSAQPVA